MKSIKYTFFIIALYSVHINAQTKDTVLTLKQAIETAISNNLQVKQSRLEVESSKINWQQAKAALYPSANISSSHGISQGRGIDPFTNSYINQQINYANYGLGSGIVLFNGLSAQNFIKQNALTYKAEAQEWQQEKDRVILNVILAYLTVLSNEDILELAKAQAEVSRQQVSRLEVLNKEGAIAPSQLYDLKGQLANDQLSVVNAENSLALSKLNLAQLMNVSYNKNMQLERLNVEEIYVSYDALPDSIFQKARQQLGIIKAAEFRRVSAQKAVQVAKGEMFPTLSLQGGINTNISSVAKRAVFINSASVPSGDYVEVAGSKLPVITTQSNYREEKIGYGNQFKNNYNAFISLSLRIPIFNGLQAKTKLALAKINAQNAQYVEDYTHIQLRQDIEQAHLYMLAAQNRYKLLTEQVEAFAESFRAAEIKFNAGVGNSVDYLIIKNNLDRAKINLVSAKYDYVLRTKILDYYQGKQP